MAEEMGFKTVPIYTTQDGKRCAMIDGQMF